MKDANPKLNSSVAGAAYSVNAVLFVLLSFIVSAIVGAAGVEETSDAYKYLSYLVAPVAVAAGCAAVLSYFKQPLRSVFPVKCHWKYYVIAALMIFGLLFCVSGVNTIALALLEKMGYVPRESSSYLPSLGGGRVVAALFVIAVLPAFTEEFFFRGVMLGNLRTVMGGAGAVFTVGACFALFHGSAEQTVYQFICGCAFSYLALRAGSPLPGVFMHLVNNGLIIILSACGQVGADGGFALPFAADIALKAVGGAAFIAAVVWLIADGRHEKREKGEKGATARFFAFAAVGIVVMGALWITSFFVR